LKNTTLGQLKVNDIVNIEVDTIARYSVNAIKILYKKEIK
jgi:riboflavin synthase alpha subunit